jgi:hypothetical protein
MTFRKRRAGLLCTTHSPNDQRSPLAKRSRGAEAQGGDPGKNSDLLIDFAIITAVRDQSRVSLSKSLHQFVVW